MPSIDQRLTKDIQFYGEGFYGNRRSQFINNSTGNQLTLAVPTINPYYPTGAPAGIRVSYSFSIDSPSVTNAFATGQRYLGGLNIDLPGDWANEILRALGCRHAFDPARGHLVTERDGDCRTSVDHVYAVGDCTGLGGAPAAEAEGVIAGDAVARSLGLAESGDRRRQAARARAALRRHRRFQSGLWTLFTAPRLVTELAKPSTVICRCEEVTLAEIEAGFAPGTRSIGAAKRATRAGMGRCQGRYCGPILAALAAAGRGLPLDEAAHWAPRPPVKPIRIADIVR